MNVLNIFNKSSISNLISEINDETEIILQEEFTGTFNLVLLNLKQVVSRNSLAADCAITFKLEELAPVRMYLRYDSKNKARETLISSSTKIVFKPALPSNVGLEVSIYEGDVLIQTWKLYLSAALTFHDVTSVKKVIEGDNSEEGSENILFTDSDLGSKLIVPYSAVPYLYFADLLDGSLLFQAVVNQQIVCSYESISDLSVEYNVPEGPGSFIIQHAPITGASQPSTLRQPVSGSVKINFIKGSQENRFDSLIYCNGALVRKWPSNQGWGYYFVTE